MIGTHSFLFLPTHSFTACSLTSNHTFCWKPTLKGYQWFPFCLILAYSKSYLLDFSVALLIFYTFLNALSNFAEMGKAWILESNKSRLNNHHSIPPESLFCLSHAPTPNLYLLVPSASPALWPVTQISLGPSVCKAARTISSSEGLKCGHIFPAPSTWPTVSAY